jgi:hypothetical protein
MGQYILKNLFITTEYPFEDSDEKINFYAFKISHELFMLLNADECSVVFTELTKWFCYIRRSTFIVYLIIYLYLHNSMKSLIIVSSKNKL